MIKEEVLLLAQRNGDTESEEEENRNRRVVHIAKDFGVSECSQMSNVILSRISPPARHFRRLEARNILREKCLR